jgi:hypothetical protein
VYKSTNINTIGIGSVNYSFIPVYWRLVRLPLHSSPLLALANVEVGRVRDREKVAKVSCKIENQVNQVWRYSTQSLPRWIKAEFGSAYVL